MILGDYFRISAEKQADNLHTGSDLFAWSVFFDVFQCSPTILFSTPQELQPPFGRLIPRQDLEDLCSVRSSPPSGLCVGVSVPVAVAHTAWTWGGGGNSDGWPLQPRLHRRGPWRGAATRTSAGPEQGVPARLGVGGQQPWPYCPTVPTRKFLSGLPCVACNLCRDG